MSSKITQTELGKEFGISSISMGKKLIELKLRDADTKLATQYAIDNKLGKIVTYTKAGQEIKMTVWNEKTIQYIKNKSSKDINFCAETLINKLKILKNIEDEDTGQKIDQMKFDCAYDDFLGLWKSYNQNMKVLSIFVNKLEKEKLMEFAYEFDELKNLKIIVSKYDLEKQLNLKNIKSKKIKL